MPQIGHNPPARYDLKGGFVNARLMIRSIALAVGLTLGLALVLAIAILLINQVGKGKSGGGNPNTPCQFTGKNPILTVYQAPITDATQEKARLSGSEHYPVIKQRSDHLLIQLRDTSTAWADRRDGTLEGNCKNVPVDDTPLTGFPTLCTFTNTLDVPLYSSAALTNVIGTVSPGTYALIGFNQNRYYLYLDTNQGGWVLGSAGLRQGNCIMLPARPG
jgi:hypothetical protein